MANAEHLAILRQGVDAWNAWREKEPSIRPDLSEANLSGANLSEANLSGANLFRADLRGAVLSEADLSDADFFWANLFGAEVPEEEILNSANLRGANLSGANLHGANLGVAFLQEANLSGAFLEWANLRGASLVDTDLVWANLRGADLQQANLSEANLVDACLDGADLTGATLWETQRADWSIKNVICRVAFWDRDGKEPTKYGEGEFERIYAEKPRIVLRYPGGISPIDLLALPLVVERLQAEYPGSALQIRSVQNDAGGASVTITVEDRENRGTEAFGQELVRIQTKLECVVEERDFLRQRVSSMFPEGFTKAAEFLAAELLARPSQIVHIHNPRALTAIEGPTMSKGDTYNIPGQAGAVGPGAHAEKNTFQQIQAGIDLPKLAEELGRLCNAMKGETTGTREHDEAIGAVAGAEDAAAKGDGPAVLQYLKSAGKWTLGIAEKIGVPLAVEALKRAM